MSRLPLLSDPACRALVAEACERHGVALPTLSALAEAELHHIGRAQRRGLPAELDAILGTAVGAEADPPAPDHLLAALDAAERELGVYEAEEARGLHGPQARALAAQVRDRITRLRAALPQQRMAFRYKGPA